MTDQLEAWQGDFGRAYTDRNPLDPRVRLEAFRRMLAGLDVRRVLEVGCNRGHNLLTLDEVLGGDADIVGVEPNRYARELARRSSDRIAVLNGSAQDLPFKDGYFDLVLTCGVLIHLSSDVLPEALAEIHRVSRRWILAVEYFAESETPVSYRGRDDLLWKRNFPALYKTQYAEVQVLRQGFWDRAEGFDRCHWWLLEKTGYTL